VLRPREPGTAGRETERRATVPALGHADCREPYIDDIGAAFQATLWRLGLIGAAVVVEAGRQTRVTIEMLTGQLARVGSVADMIGEIAARTNLLGRPARRRPASPHAANASRQQ
jgi:hypothetical protein